MQEEFYFFPKSGKIISIFCNYRSREILTKQQSLQYYIFITIILATLRLPGTFNRFSQSILPLNYLCVGRFAGTISGKDTKHIYFKNCRATDYKELVNGYQIVGE
jgi:hypothetical protein